MPTVRELEAHLKQLREQTFQTAVKMMITHIARKIHLKIKRLEAAGQLGDKSQWERFFRNLHPAKQRILLRHTAEIFEQVREMKHQTL